MELEMVGMTACSRATTVFVVGSTSKLSEMSRITVADVIRGTLIGRREYQNPWLYQVHTESNLNEGNQKKNEAIRRPTGTYRGLCWGHLCILGINPAPRCLHAVFVMVQHQRLPLFNHLDHH